MGAGLNLDAVSSTVKSASTSSIKSAFGALGLSLVSAAGSIGIAALERKLTGGSAFQTPVTQARAAEQLAAPLPAQRSTAQQKASGLTVPLLAVTGIGLVTVLSFYFISRRRRA